MQQRRTLSLKAAPSPERIAAPNEPIGILREAIAHQTCVAAVYNRMAIQLAPRTLYDKHGDLFVDAVVVERDGQPPRELKLGTFKLAGLSGITGVARSAAAPAVRMATRKVKMPAPAEAEQRAE